MRTSSGKWKAESPARANTGSSIRGKISAPIPIPDDEEFPIRAPGTGIATPLGSEFPDQQQAMRSSFASGRPGSGLSRELPVILPSDLEQPSIEAPAGPIRRPMPPSNLRNSEFSESLLGEGGAQPPQRKKSSFRSALSKIFGGSKKRKSGLVEKPSTPNGARHGQHRSDPSAMNSMARTSPKDSVLSQKRTASLPINEYNRALRSHSIGPDSFLQHENEAETEPEPNTVSIRADGYTRPRRATTPSNPQTIVRTAGFPAGDFTGLSPRPISSHARASDTVLEEDPEVIGYAVTKGSHPHRRSRSVGQLRDAAADPGLSRRRSDEIRYWRESYDPGALSPMSSNKPDGEPFLNQPEFLHQTEVAEPPQPFNFGPMGEMAGMKITQAANLDTRVSRIEDRMVRVEKIVHQIQHSAQLGHVQLQDPPKRHSKLDEAAPLRYQAQSTDVYSKQADLVGSRPSTTSTNNSYHPTYVNSSPPPSFLTSAPPTSSQDTARHSTSTTLPGCASSSPISSKQNSLTTEQYTTLTNMILAEQAARQKLEAQVYHLQKQLAVALRPTRKAPVSTHSNSGSGYAQTGYRTENLSSFEQDDSSEDEGRYDNENFLTPREELVPMSADEDTFGNGMVDSDTKTTPRTMSLSQITMKPSNGMHTAINF